MGCLELLNLIKNRIKNIIKKSFRTQNKTKLNPKNIYSQPEI